MCKFQYSVLYKRLIKFYEYKVSFSSSHLHLCWPYLNKNDFENFFLSLKVIDLNLYINLKYYGFEDEFDGFLN